MPYISQDNRAVAGTSPASPGELSYALMMVAIQCVEGKLNASQFGLEALKSVEDYLEVRGGRNEYTSNEVMGVLTCVPMELERRLQDNDLSADGVEIVKREMEAYRSLFYALTIAPYEDGRIEIFGDVFPENLI